jgi:hypothetical protein
LFIFPHFYDKENSRCIATDWGKRFIPELVLAADFKKKQK